jgi:hypothetical protein
VIPTVKDFLLALYASNHHELMQNIDDQILQAKMNFTHFASTNEDLLPGDPTISLCHDLLRRCAALQLSHDNSAFDQLIPTTVKAHLTVRNAEPSSFKSITFPILKFIPMKVSNINCRMNSCQGTYIRFARGGKGFEITGEGSMSPTNPS